jgi:hypothetical protein
METIYAYSKLPSPTYTRLLELQPSEDPDAELRCRLYAAELYGPVSPDYEAISYTWGTNTLSQTLGVDVVEGISTRLLITANLSDALRRLRSSDTLRALWADAVCINQDDDDEKSRHIPLMTDIYRGASRVLVWLGGNWADEEQALLHIKSLARYIHSKSDAFPFDLHRQSLTDAVTGVVRLPWFSRRWVIQKVVLNPDVVLICGSQQLSFGRLGQVVDRLLSDDDGDDGAPVVWKGFSAMLDLWKRSTLAPPAAKLSELIINFEHFECADARDRIFTLLIFATHVTMSVSQQATPPPQNLLQKQGPVLSIDYSSSIENVYISTAMSLVETRGLEWVLIQAMTRGDYGQRSRLLPSWVPDWRIPPQRRSLWPLHGNPESYTEMHSTPISSIREPEAHVLRARLVTVRDLDPSVLRNSTREYSPEPRDSRLATLAVSSKSRGCPAATSNRLEIISWIRSTFFEMWNRCRLALGKTYLDPSPALLEKHRVEFIAHFAKAITLKGQCHNELHPQYKLGLVILQKLLKRFELLPQKTYEMTVPLQDAMRTSFGSHSLYDLRSSDHMELSLRFSIHYLLDVDDNESISMFDTILDLITLSMKDRCVFQADWSWNQKCSARDILGTGPSQLIPGDEVIFFHYRAVRAHVSLPMVVRVREMAPSIQYATSRMNGQSSGSRLTYTFVGDCFVSLPDELFLPYISDSTPLVII